MGAIPPYGGVIGRRHRPRGIARSDSVTVGRAGGSDGSRTSAAIRQQTAIRQRFGGPAPVHRTARTGPHEHSGKLQPTPGGAAGDTGPADRTDDISTPRPAPRRPTRRVVSLVTLLESPDAPAVRRMPTWAIVAVLALCGTAVALQQTMVVPLLPEFPGILGVSTD